MKTMFTLFSICLLSISTNAQSWKLVSIQPWGVPSTCMLESINNTSFYAGVSSTSQSFLESNDSAKSFTSNNAGLTIHSPKATRLKKDTILLAHADFSNGGFYVKHKNDNAWIKRENGLVSKIINDIELVDDKIFAATMDGIYVSSNNGNTWTQSKGQINGSSSSLACRDLLLVKDTLFAIGGAKLTYTTDEGATWVDKDGNGSTLFALGYFNKAIYAAFNNGVIKSTNSGTNWTASWTQQKIKKILVEGQSIFVQTTDGSLGADPWFAYSIDSGKTFVKSVTGLPAPSMVCAALTKTNDAVYGYWFLNSNSDTINGIYKMSLDDFNTSTGIFNVSRNTEKLTVYPNPANDFINVKINSNAVSHLYIKDVLGNVIDKIPVDQNNISVSISKYPSGIYFIQDCNGKFNSRFLKK